MTSQTYTVSRYGIVLANYNPVTIASGVTITGTSTQKSGDGIYGATQSWTVVNSGTIAGGSTGDGIYLTAGGAVTNGQSGSGGGVIAGSRAVLIENGVGSITNYGTIVGTGASYSDGVDLFAGGAVANFGTIIGTAAGSSFGVSSDGGSVVNGASGATSALILGAYAGVSLGGTAAGTVVNFGTIASVATGGAGVFLNAGGTVSNFGTIAGGPGGLAIYTRGGASVSNAVGAVIAGIDITRGAGTVDNLGTVAVTGTDSTAIQFDGGSVVNGQSGSSAGLIEGGYFAIHIGGSAGTVVNFGTIAGTSGHDGAIRMDARGIVANYGIISGGPAPGVYMGAGGAVTNGQSGSGGGVIAGSRAVLIENGVGSITNFGTIVGTGASYSDGVDLFAGGTVANFGTILGTAAGSSFGVASEGVVVNGASGATSALILGAYAGVSLGGTAAGTVVNFGTIASVYPGRLGVFLRTGGTVSNYGTIAGGPGGDGIYTQAGASVSNAQGAVIVGSGTAVEITRGTGTVHNLGTIAGIGTGSTAIGLFDGGLVVNGQSGSTAGLISGGYFAVQIGGASGTVVNFATITGTSGHVGAIRMDVGGSVANYGTISGGPASGVFEAGGSVTNGRRGSGGELITGSTGVLIGDAGGTVTNYGTIAGTAASYSDGVLLEAGGAVTNFGTILGTGAGGSVGVGIAAGTVVNGASGSAAALILGYYAGVAIGTAGRVVNFGTIASVATGRAGVLLDAGGTVSNYGTIAGGPGGVGLYLRNGGDVTNQPSGVIIGEGSGVAISRAAGTVVNYGTIIATGSYASAVDIRYGVFVNHGLVEGAASGIVLGGTITPFGTIGSTGTAFASGMVAISGTVSGTVGISVAPGITAGYTLTVGGTVMSTLGSAGTAIQLGSGDNRIVLGPGANFQGAVDGGAGGNNVLEFDAGSYFRVALDQFRDFKTLLLDSQVTLGMEPGKVKFDTLLNEGNLKVEKGDSFAFGKVSAASVGIVEFNAGTVTFSGSVVHQTLDFVTVGGTAVIDDPKEFFGTITGFTAGDRIIVAPIVVSSGQTSGGNTLQIGFTETVLSGGTASGTTIDGGGSERVYGRASGDTVNSGGVERVYGRASGGTVTSGGQQIVESGGVASALAVKSGGKQTVYSGGTASGTVLSGGAQTVRGATSGSVVSSGGNVVVMSGGKASGGTIHDGLIEVASGGSASGTVSFVSGGTLQLDAGASLSGKVKGFAVPDRIDLRSVAFGAGTMRSFTEAASHTSGTLTVTDGTHTVHLTLLGKYTTSSFSLSSDGHGGTRVTDPPIAGGASRTTFPDLTPDRSLTGTTDPGIVSTYLAGPAGANQEAHAGETLFATGPPAAPSGGEHNSVAAALR